MEVLFPSSSMLCFIVHKVASVAKVIASSWPPLYRSIF